ncbi:hypothetical protein B5M09_004459 [Aphanomyces astaci]|uniref:Protein kinase domain-containing protein n=1 Tax=Aphanomyces astaci TaxID=112090 RepID=A0A425D1X6_APHAT|nr:hypothetical protein B5M09_004459 [Aphanomyces astaci]
MDQFPVLKRMADAIYGEVLLCRDAVMFDIVAVKKIYMHRAARRHSDVHKHAVHEDVLFELDVNQRVQLAGGHPHICRLRHHFTYVDTAMSHPILAMVFDYCPHGELLTTLSASKRFTELVALRYVAQIAQAIDFLHLLHIAHRDISLENILLDGAHRAKLCDFGLACDDRMVKTEPVGKLLYMAPEVLAGEEYAPAQADMWSLGVALFTMVVGHYPFHEASMHDPFYSVFARVGLSSLLRKHGVGHISVELQSLLEKLLHVNPDQRIQCQHLLAHPLVEPFVDDDADTTSFSTVSLEDERSKAVAVKDIRVCHGGVTWELEGTINETLLTDLFELDRRLLRRPSALCLVTPGKVMVVAKLDRKVLMYVCPGKIKVVREMDELLQKVIEETGDGHDITYTLSVLFAKPDVPYPEDDDALESQPLADGKMPPACSSRNPKLGTEYDNQPARMDSTALRTSVSRQHNNQMIGQSDDELKSISADMSTGDAKLILRPDGEPSNVPDGCQHDDDDDSEARQQVKVTHFLQPTTTSTVVEKTAAALSPPQRDELPIAEAYPDFKLPLTSVECTRSSAFGNPDKPSSPTMKDDNNNTSGCAASARASSTSVAMQLDNSRLQTTPRHSGDTPCNNNMLPSPRLPPLALLDNVVVDPSRHHDHNNTDDCYATDNNNPSTQRTPELVETATATTSPARPFVARPPVVTIISHSKSTVHEAPTTYKAKLGEVTISYILKCEE